MILPNLDPVAGSDALPDQVDAVVIGGGIVGVAAAYSLAKKGFSVALVEKGRIAAEQSSRNWGWCRTQNRDRRELPLQLLSMQIWDGLARDIGDDTGFRRSGLIYVTKDPAELATWTGWLDMAREYQVRHTVLTAEEAKALTPGNEQAWIGGIHAPTEGRAVARRAGPGPGG